MASSKVQNLPNKLESPLVFSTSNFLCKVGLLISASMMSTREPVCAKVMAILAHVVVLPSSGKELVTTIFLQPLPARENMILVRVALYASCTWKLDSGVTTKRLSCFLTAFFLFFLPNNFMVTSPYFIRSAASTKSGIAPSTGMS